MIALLISYGFKAHGLDLSHFHGDVARSSFYYAFGMIPLAALIGIIVVSTVDNKKIILMSVKKINKHKQLQIRKLQRTSNAVKQFQRTSKLVPLEKYIFRKKIKST